MDKKEKFVAALPTMPIDTLVQRYVAVREARALSNSEADKVDREFKELLKHIEVELLRRAQAEGVEGFKTSFGTTYREITMSASFADEDTFYKFVRETGDLEFFERRIKVAHLKEWMDAHQGQLPPGLNIFREYTMRVRKA